MVPFASDIARRDKPLQILLVEDSPTQLARISEALEVCDPPIHLTTARTMAEAHAYLAKQQPDLAIVDLILPDGSGSKLLPAGREEVRFPIIILTSQGDEKEAVAAMKAGALDYLVKSAATLAEMPRIIERTMGVWGHITDRRRAEKTLRESEERFRSVFFSSAVGMAIISPAGDFMQVNPAHCQKLGYTEEEMRHLKVGDITHPEDRAETLGFYRQFLAGQRSHLEYEKRYLCKDGSILWGHVTVSGVYDDQHRLLYYVGQMQDITERKRTEAALRESEERFRSVFVTGAAGMVILSPTGRIFQVNPALCRFLGYSEAELTQLSIDDITHPDDRELTTQSYGEIFAGRRETLHYEKRYLRKDGQTVWGHVSVACVLDAETRPLYCIGLVQDITEHKRAEEKLREANRELDAFVRTVSHDLRTPLTPIIGYAELLREQYRERLDEPALNSLAEIQRQGHRMLGLLEDLLALARVGHLERPPAPVAVSEVVQEVVLALGSQMASAGVGVAVGALPNLRVPRTLLVQLFDNLIVNAIRYAAQEGGVIEVWGERLGERVRLYVRDHGPGIPPEERSRVFDLFYRGSTGEKLEGTGVGLATVQKIARLYGGQAWVEETPGGGSTFWVEMIDG